jgi:hypothetical protein
LEFGAKTGNNFERTLSLREENVMDEERFDFENLKVYQKALAMDSNLRTPNSELRTIFLRKNSFDEVLSQLTRAGLSTQPITPQKVLFWGERAGEISSYVAGWLAGKEIEVIVLDGANCFDPYMVSSFARKAWIPPEKLLKRIRIARAFTCHQMAMMVGERLSNLLSHEGATNRSESRWVILLGLITPFMDEDVSEREVRPLFEKSLKKIEEMALKGIPLLLFQTPNFSGSKRVYLLRRLFQFSNLIWKISLEGQESRVVLEKSADSVIPVQTGIQIHRFLLSQE